VGTLGEGGGVGPLGDGGFLPPQLDSFAPLEFWIESYHTEKLAMICMRISGCCFDRSVVSPRSA
jgi:hypothetical protein